jgi:hypothetical protein
MRNNKYFEEIKYLKKYLIILILFILSGYLLCSFVDSDTMPNIAEENNVLEWMTALLFLTASIIFIMLFIKSRNYFSLLLGVIFFMGFGEEIAWGQYLFNLKVPERIAEINSQNELTIHNLNIFHSHNSEGQYKSGLHKLLTINFLAKVFFVLWGVVLPFCTYHLRFFSSITTKIKLPIPPITMGFFFIINWFIIKVILFITTDGRIEEFDYAINEIFETSEAFISVLISLYFYNNRNVIIWGKDVKQII